MFGKLRDVALGPVNSIKRALVIRTLRSLAVTAVTALAAQGWVAEAHVQAASLALGVLAVVVYQVAQSDTPVKVQLAQYASLIFTGGLVGLGVVTPEQAASASATLIGSDVVGGETVVRLLEAIVTVGSSVAVTAHNERKGVE